MPFSLSWKPDPNVPYPQTWATFKAKDLNSDALVEYRIEDLPEDRFEELFQMKLEFLNDEPGNSFLRTANDPVTVANVRGICEAAHRQRLINVCFREGSDEMIGFNILFVVSKVDKFSEQLAKKVWAVVQFVILKFRIDHNSILLIKSIHLVFTVYLRGGHWIYATGCANVR